MGQYDEVVERQRQLLAAEEWAKGVKSIHAHSLSSMWYDDRPQDTDGGKCVTDIEFNSGQIRRELSNGEVVIIGKALTGDDLIQSYKQNTH